MKKHSFINLFKEPEVQFFIIFSIPFVGFFLVNYFNIDPTYQLLAVILFGATLAIVLFQTIYGVVAHRTMRMNEDDFISATAHQIRTPLTAVKWTLDELARKEIREDERVELLKMASVSTQKLTRTVDLLSRISEVRDAEFGYQADPLDVAELISRSVSDADLIAKQFGVAVYAEQPTSRMLVKGDGIKLGMVLADLINNGIKYNRSGGMVTVRARELVADKQVEISVEDTGVGFNAAEAELLFGKYFRTEAAKKMNVAGSGLGLYLSKIIIAQHHGRIWAESLPGKGSTFHITLPLLK